MFDLITLVKQLQDDEVSLIVDRNGLQTNSNAGIVFYDNMDTKNLSQQKGVFIRIETNQKLKVETSLHKFFNEIAGRERNNINLFSMSDAKRTIDQLLIEKHITADDLRVYNFEMGLNLNVSKDCRVYMDRMKSIGSVGNEKQLYVNARYKDERMKTTVFHKHTRKYFKVYDKVYESLDKKRKDIPDENILRIETVNRRLDNCSVADFFSPANMDKLVETFFRDWRTIQFEQDIITPKDTGRARQHLCLEIMNKGKDAVLKQAKERHGNGSLTDWGYRNTREFIVNEWDTIKKNIRFIQSDEEQEFRQLMKVNYTLLKNDEILK